MMILPEVASSTQRQLASEGRFSDPGGPRHPHAGQGKPEIGRYRLLAQLGAGGGGVRYRAFDPQAQDTVELVVIDADVSGVDSDRAHERARRLRLAAMLVHPTARRVRDLGLDQSPAFIVLDRVEEAAFVPGSWSWPEVLSTARALASGLAEAHRLGLAHGQLAVGTVAVAGTPRFKIDWMGFSAEATTSQEFQSLFVAPEQVRGRTPTPAGDVFTLAGLMTWWATGQSSISRADSKIGDILGLDSLIREMRAADPSERPAAREVAERLTTLLSATTVSLDGVDGSPDEAVTPVSDDPGSFEDIRDSVVDPGQNPVQLGRFLLREKLGEGGMGAVYRGEDLADGSTVAIKVLRGARARRPESLRRFSKEARLLAEAKNPYVANLIEFNEDRGVYYLALEYIQGTTLARWIEQRGRLDEPTALTLVADVARGLSLAHERGIIHRDIKPENILLIEPGPDAPAGQAVTGSTTAIDPPPRTAPRVKLSDFGLARHIKESESLNLTQAGAILGTPLYMAPEQCTGSEALGPGADVYALGATLFRLLAGRTPFVGGTTVELIAKHQHEPPPSLRTLNEEVSEGVCEVVAKAMAKRPGERYRDAGEMLDDLERLLRGEPTGIGIHPRIPASDPRDLVPFDFQWELEASPLQLWPHVSNTERLNRALGLPAVPFTTGFDPDAGVKRFGTLKTAGLTVTWREHPFEWVEGRRMGVLREFSQGPFRWFVSIVELSPRAGGGTILRHRIRISAKGFLGRTLAHVKIGNQARRAMDQVYRRIDAVLTGKLGRDATLDPFEPPAALTPDRRGRLDRWLASLGRHGLDPRVVERFGDFLAEAPAQEVARIRPLALARRLGLDAEQVVAACLHGAKDGTLILLWDILCPICRIPSQVLDSLRALRDHGHCEACHLDFELDFANSVEMIFRAHPEVRDTEVGTYCVGGPAHSPHVVAQVRVGPGERIVLDLQLGEGAYRLRGPQLAYSIDFRVEPGAPSARWDLVLSRGPGSELVRSLRTDGQVISLNNDGGHELLVRVERTASRDDALTAARASSRALFRDLFPGEVLSHGQLINLANVTLVVTALGDPGELYKEFGDAKAFGVIHEHFRLIDACLRRHGGALIKTVNEGIVAVFSVPASAVEAALELAPTLAEGDLTRDLKLRVGVHRGPALVATLNDHLDYFGTTVCAAMRLPESLSGGGILLSRSAAADPRVARLLLARRITPTIIPVPPTVLPEGFAHRLDPLGPSTRTV